MLLCCWHVRGSGCEGLMRQGGNSQAGVLLLVLPHKKTRQERTLKQHALRTSKIVWMF